MKIINTGNTYRIFGNDLKTYEKLPPQNYVVCFSRDSGFYLEGFSDIESGEEKTYGIHQTKVEKVLRSFDIFERNLGVILSGDKGIGKSLFARMLAEEGLKLGYPLIIVNSYIPGIASYLSTIDQKAIVLFDEFDKTFSNSECAGEAGDPQTEMLSLFDGLAGGKKLFVITCNDIERLSDYLINRPGRFHYHFRFDYPTADEVTEYLTDKLNPEYHDQIPEVVAFSRRIDLNYDCLRSIAFEINTGMSFAEAISDLNILNYGDTTYHTISVEFSNGTIAACEYAELGGEIVNVWCGHDGNAYLKVVFRTCDIMYDPVNETMYVPVDKVVLYWEDHPMHKEIVSVLKDCKIKSVHITKSKKRNLHYAL